MEDLSNMGEPIATKIQISLTRIEERQVSQSKEISALQASVDKQLDAIQREADHRHRGIKMQLENFVPRREVESMVDAVKTHCDTNRAVVLEKVLDLDSRQKKFIGGLWSLFFLIIPSLGALVWQALKAH